MVTFFPLKYPKNDRISEEDYLDEQEEEANEEGFDIPH